MTDLLTDLLARGAPAGGWAGVDLDALDREAVRHGVRPLLWSGLAGDRRVPEALRARFLETRLADAAEDLAREVGLRAVIAGFAGAGVRTLVFKGAQLAYTHYPRPELRPRLDSDILIGEAERPAAEAVLSDLGYAPDVQAGTAGILHQRPYTRASDAGPLSVVDLHWRVLNPEVFRGVLEYDELVEAAVPIPVLGPAARGLHPVHALLVACVHRVAHHFDDDRLIWLYDIHLLASGLTAGDWRRFVTLALDRRVSSVCAAGLRQAAAGLDTPVPGQVWARMAGRREAPGEVTARYLSGGRAHARVVLDDLRALPTWTDRWRVVRGHAFPPARYMREVYAPASRRPLVWLYASRIVRGARRWLRGRAVTQP